ncbi:MAG: tetratricopeptide repeat protein [Bacteroidetes bacterium]|nr:tetratricopeptide repeat protein [Bacteroidota bacterium]
MKKLLSLIPVFCCCVSFSQQIVLDSLRQQVRIHKDADTARVFYLNELAYQYLDYNTDTAKMYNEEAMALAEKINYVDGMITGRNVKGLLLRMNNQLDEALKVGEEVLELRKKNNSPDRYTGAYTNIGSVYLVKGDYVNALKYLNLGLDNAKRWNQIENQIVILTNIGIVYNNSELNDLALETLQKAVVLNKQLKGESQKLQQAQLYINIATIYHKRGLYDEAEKYFKSSYETYKKENNIRDLSIVVYNLTSTTRFNKDMKACEFFIKEMEKIAAQLHFNDYTASLHLTKANYLLEINKATEALVEVNKGLAIIDTITSQQTYGVLLGVKADCYKSLKDYNRSLEFSNKALTVIRQTGNTTEEAVIFMNQSQVYRALKDYKMALSCFERSVLIRDSINSELFDTRIATLNSFNQLDKKEKELALSNNEKDKAFLENKRQTTLLIAGSVVGVLVVVLLILSLRAYKVKQKDNVLLNSQKEEIEIKNVGLQESKKEIEHQKNIVDEKQKEIVDSINYALQIQKTLIANHELVNQTIPDSFVFFKPKDIVSGDFYWATKKNKRFYLAVCDSTGHGVPGAFMSLLNINYLNEAIKEKNLIKPCEIFDHVRKRLIETISQNGRKDGMDGILICIEEKNNTITYAAANNRPVLISENKLNELQCDKMPVGVGEKKEPFTEFSFEGKKGDMLYLYTDGFPDQFGGPKGKKFKYKQLEELLLENNNLDVYKQEVVLKQKFESWIGPLEQVDDVCVLGVRLYTNESVYPGAEKMAELERSKK